MPHLKTVGYVERNLILQSTATEMFPVRKTLHAHAYDFVAKDKLVVK